MCLKKVSRGEVYWIDGRKEENYRFKDFGVRPWVVVSCDIANKCGGHPILAMLTTNFGRADLPQNIPVTWEGISPSIVSCSNIITAPAGDDWKLATKLPEEIMKFVDGGLRAALFGEVVGHE